ncbi:RNA-processing protein [Candidatus Woesearchaeota archaeon]|nr:RNA-processing protein [Candidatus Woesearchaeota archaeon]
MTEKITSKTAEGHEFQEFEYSVKIPKDRIAVLIGTNGEQKKSLEEDMKCRINVDSKEGDVTISGKDSLAVFTLREIVKAIARGFNPDKALLLLKQDNALEILNLNEFADKGHYARLKGRIIGAKGKSREMIEKLTETYISVYGKTISIIGETQHVFIAKRAVESLLAGSLHKTVYKFMEKQRRELKQREMMS